jgi:hypothetical protein
MLRFTMALLVTTIASGTAECADQALPRQTSHHGWHRTAVILPAGLPRPHYRFRTTISYRTHVYRQSGPRLSVYENPRDLYAPDYTEVTYARRVVRAPLVIEPASLPGYYGSSYSYEYEGPYYGGPDVSYRERLPYACGPYGYC